ncbi:MOSC domain-containing protein [Saccharomonospora piscinae]|uniref:MOSC domain-containing protein n=1 Tax=Saccharomonospora piscinae TaxID=687388 RepID=A0A1V9ACJ6_SACPI|nr:MOSC N-terminal beta barrel domain-containing protein [Saccharomonospora piscinae]OQO94849.1 MOSC domain-containing protein [Saccharomonospora piscinae]
MARVAGLFHYPIKGCAAVEVNEGHLGLAGLAADRAFMVVDAEGGFLSQRRTPGLAVVRPALDDSGDRLTLAAPGVESLALAVDPAGPRRPVRLHGKDFSGADQGDGAAEWFSSLLGRACRLVRVPPEHDRVTDGETPGTSGYADSSAVLVVATGSVADLNARIADSGGDAVPMDRFRPNVVVSGWDEPYAEDRARRIEVGQAELGFTKLAIRCAVTTVDQRTGRRSGPEPLRTLAGFRRRPGGVALGAKFSVVRAGKVSVGDEFRVRDWATA